MLDGLARLIGALSRRLGAGSGGTLPGRVLLKVDDGALARLASRHRVVLVTGTNGKSSTSAFLRAALEGSSEVVGNTDGANLLGGLVTALLGRSRPPQSGVAVLEVDEMVLAPALSSTDAEVVVLLNLSRDQLDRFFEVTSNVARWAAALTAVPAATVVANVDDPLIVEAVLRARQTADVVWVGSSNTWVETTVCPRCGGELVLGAGPWRCADCDLARPEPAFSAIAARSEQPLPEGVSAEVHTPDGVLEVPLNLAGAINVGNAAMAIAAATELGVIAPTAAARLASVRQVDGRYARAHAFGHDVELRLAKNPAGWTELLGDLATSTRALVLGLNSRSADGRDPSWIWDAPFELLRGRDVRVYGERGLDLAVRLDYAGVGVVTCSGLEDAITGASGPVTLAANYTAFVQARTALGVQRA